MPESPPAASKTGMLVLRILAFGGFALSPAFAQNAFDVASITLVPPARSTGEGSGRERISWNPREVNLQNASLSACIEWAWQVRFYQISGPDWIHGPRYDVVGKTDRPVGLSDLRQMLQRLLAERFRLALHPTEKPMPVFDLTAMRGGPKLTPAAPAEKEEIRVSNGRFVFRGVSMAALAGRLSELAGVDRPVIDKTGIDGAFDFSLPAIPHRPGDGEAQWLFAALEEELGLTLKPAKGSVEMLAIDHAEKPTPN